METGAQPTRRNWANISGLIIGAGKKAAVIKLLESG